MGQAAYNYSTDTIGQAPGSATSQSGVFTIVDDATLSARAIQFDSSPSLRSLKFDSVPTDCVYLDVQFTTDVSDDGRPGFMLFQDPADYTSGVWAQYDNRVDNRWEVLGRTAGSTTETIVNGSAGPTTTDYMWRILVTREWATVGSTFRTRITIYSWSGSAWVSHATGTTTTYTTGGLAIYSSGGLSAQTIGPVSVNYISSASDDFDVYVFAGQSNMVGRGTPINTSIDVFDWRVAMLDQSGNVLPAFEPVSHVNPQANTVGMARSFTDEMLDSLESGRHILVVPVAEGDTGFSSNDWNKGDGNYTNAVNLTAAAMALGGNNALRQVLWHQGEKERTSESNANSHLLSFLNFVIDFRSDVGDSAIKFIAGGLADDLLESDPEAFQINNQIVAVMRMLPNCYFADGSGLSTETGGVHFDEASIRAFGVRYSSAQQMSFKNQLLMSGFGLGITI